MSGALRRFVLTALLAVAPAVVPAQQQEPPRFRSSVELTSIDVSVYDDRGRPVVDLTPDEFSVRVDGVARQVVSAEWIPLEVPEGQHTRPVPAGYSTNESATGGRLILIVIDQPNIRFGGTFGIQRAVQAFIDRLQPADRAAVIGIGVGSPSTPFTADRELLKKTVARMVGQHQTRMATLHSIGLAEAMDIRRGVSSVLLNVITRECRDFGGGPLASIELDSCVFEVQQEAEEISQMSVKDGRESIATLRALLRALRTIDAPKTLVLVSEGFVIDDRLSDVIELGTLAGAARTSIYALKLDDQLFTALASEAMRPVSPMDDRVARAQGLEVLASASRGSLFNIVGTGAGVFDRIQSEISGYYLLGIESGATDKDGKAHPIRVDVSRQDVSVRARRALLSLSDVPQPRNPREAVLSALATPLPMSGLPLRVATYSLQGPEIGKVQLLIHADVGADYSSSRVVSLGYLIVDGEGRVVESQTANARLPPIMNGVPSALQFSGGASLPPGEEPLKLAVAEGDRVGTVEHNFRAGVAEAGELGVSDLMVGGPSNVRQDLFQPTVGYSVVFGGVHGYIEAYGSGVAALAARYEIAASETGAALLDDEVAPMLAGDSRAIFTRVLPVRQLPPGPYYLRVTLSDGSAVVKTTTQAFEVATPAVLMTSAAAASDVTVVPGSEVYLPVADAMFQRAFDRAGAAGEATVQAFRNRVRVTKREAFDKGIQAFSAGAYYDAERSFKSAIDPDDDSSTVLAYLGATYAASGHDTEAAGAWQTAIIDAQDMPDIYDWLIGALMRTHELSLARTMLEEAAEKWPSDVRFMKPMALVYATFGQGREAVRTLERHLTERPDDSEALLLGVEWIYQLHAAGVVARSSEQDLRLARTYAEAYTKSNGPQTALVRQWLGFIEGRK